MSRFIKHINLAEVCAELPGFIWLGDEFCPTKLASVPAQLAAEVMRAFKHFAYDRGLGRFGDVKNGVAPERMSEILDYELGAVYDSLSRGEPLPGGRVGLNTGRPVEATMRAMLIVQFDWLCGYCREGNLDEAMRTFVGILETQRDISELDGSESAQFLDGFLRSINASGLAEQRHARTNQQKSNLLAEWEATASEYESRADFARIVSQREGLKYRTLYDWIAAHDRAKA